MRFCPQCAQPLRRLELSGKTRDVCMDNRCGFVNWNNPVPVVAGIVEWNDHVILLRNVGWPATWYGLCTGFLEAGEMPEEAVVREVKEETGLDGTLQSYVGMYEFHRRNQLLICYHVTVDSNEVTCPPDEIADHKWIHIEKVQPWTAGTGQALRDWLRSRGIEREMREFGEVNV
ncbi:MAG: NUDIX domain-containing protein [Gammaproteobacteria bacterium]|nr:NUDIX domain-containing protein [Gammaproteobacteria bacterium]